MTIDGGLGVFSKTIAYKAGYKYQLYETVHVSTKLRPWQKVESDYITLDTRGNLYVKRGYAWDGPSWPAIDTPNFMRGSLIHDALYQLIREGGLEYKDRLAADEELRRICLEDGMSTIRAWWVYTTVRLVGWFAAIRKYDRPILIAP